MAGIQWGANLSTKKGSHLEETYLLQVLAAGLPEPEREVQVIEGRRFKHDFCWRDKKILVEIQGAVWVKGGHSTGTGINRDAEKLNLSTLAGWKTFIFTGDHLKSGQALEWTKEALW